MYAEAKISQKNEGMTLSISHIDDKINKFVMPEIALGIIIIASNQ